MGALFSYLRRVLNLRDWPSERKRFQKTRQELMQTTIESRASEGDLMHMITQMKRQVNELFFAKEARTKAHNKPMDFTDDERRIVQQMVNDIQMHAGELQLKSKYVQMLQKQLNNITTYIMQQDTLHQLRKTMDVVKEVGMDFDGTDMILEETATTSDRMDAFTTSSSDRMAAVLADNATNSSLASDILSGSRIPFPDVAPEQYNIASTTKTSITTRIQDTKSGSVFEIDEDLSSVSDEMEEEEEKRGYMQEGSRQTSV